MSSREDVHREFGAAAEMAQAMEYDLGRALLAHEGLERRVYLLDEPWEPDKTVLEEIQGNTLGRSMRQIREKYNIVGRFDLLDEAIKTRNFLVHRFFREHLNEMETASGCETMCTHLQELQRELWQGHQIAKAMANSLLGELERMFEEYG